MGLLRHGSARAVWVAVPLLVWAAGVRAGSDYSDKDFSLRLASAFIRFTEVSAMGGSTAANRYSSAVNPAAAGWFVLPEGQSVVVAPYGSTVCFKEGNRIFVTGQNVTIRTERWGTFQPSLGQVNSNRDADALGREFDYEVRSLDLRWGRREGDVAVGANFNYSDAKVLLNGPGPTPGSTLRAEGNAESYRFRFGGLWEFVDDCLGGLVLEYGFQPRRSTANAVIPVGPPPTPPMRTFVSDHTTQHMMIFRPAVSYEYAEHSNVSLDYEYGRFFNNDDLLQSHRFTAAVQQRVLEWVFARAGVFADVRGNVGCAAGASVQFARWGGFDVGYQYDALPELRPEFGLSHTVQATLNLRF